MNSISRKFLPSVVQVTRAMATNQVARFFPAAYVKLTGDSGRGPSAETEQTLVDYTLRCFNDYIQKLGVPPNGAAGFLHGRRVLEYGPGDFPGMAVLMIAHGARSVVCVDRFPLLRLSAFNIRALDLLLSTLTPVQREEALRALAGTSAASGLNPHTIRYIVSADGLSNERNCIDLAISRAVLEHVNDLPATFVDMHEALTRDGIGVHLVDLKSHRLHRANPLDFLTWPEGLWRSMFSYKGAPNRLRPDAYRKALFEAGLQVDLMAPTTLAKPEDIEAVRPHLAAPFRGLSDDDLAWEGFWLLCRRKQAWSSTNAAQRLVEQPTR